MALSIRLDEALEREVFLAAKQTRLEKSELVRQCLKRFLSVFVGKTSLTPYRIYQQLESRLPAGSEHGPLSIDHRSEVLKRIRKEPR